jgi:hypothetical protein
VLKAQTKKNGLAGPSQLTRLKLPMRISTPIISIERILLRMKRFRALANPEDEAIAEAIMV